jgi:hypothetical protein
MADEAEHGRTVLSAVIAGRSVRALTFAQSKLGHPERYFTDPLQLGLFRLLSAYEQQAGGIITRDALGDLLRDKPAGTLQLYGETYDALAASVPDGHVFMHAVGQLRELADRRATGAALATGMKIMQQGVRLTDGTEAQGHADAREFVLGALAEAQALGTEAETPEGDVTREAADVMADYAAAKALRMSGRPVGVQFGLPSLDEALGGGLGKGLALVVAGTTVGKSSLCVQLAWYNAVIEGLNVLFFTTEQHRSEVRVKLVSRHSRHPKFGLGSGLDSSKIMSGWLSGAEEKALDWVLDDLKTGGYGELQTVQMPEHCTVGVISGRAESMARRQRPDLMVFDYLQLCDPERRSRDSREHENQSGIVKGAHRWAQTAFRGKGVPLVSPWQANQGGAQALRGGEGGFSLDTHMSQTKEAGNTAAVVLTLAAAQQDVSRGRNVPLRLTVEKNRGGARGFRASVTADYATSCFWDSESEDPGDAGDEFDLGA